MKKWITVSLLLALSANVQAQENEAKCRQASLLAEAIMVGRQNGDDKAGMLDLAKNHWVARELIKTAYEFPQLDSAQKRRELAGLFKKGVYDDCLIDTQND
ncbi:MAG: hypothetical protein KA735_15040 [Burkholderiaceae bacterium]|nr:hypothetical protein [Burkholderiaceae bacterium]